MKEKILENKNIVIGAAIALFVLVGLLLWILETELPQGNAQLVPQTQSEEGIAPDTAFLLKVSSSSGSVAELRKKLVFEPALAYSVEELGNNQYLIQPSQALQAGSTLKARFGNQRFSFTVENLIVVTKVFPFDGANNVPLTSGIEFSFNTREINAAQVKQAFSISPAVECGIAQNDERFVFYPTAPFEAGITYTVTVQGLETPDGAHLAEAFTLSFTAENEETPEQRYFQMYGNGVSTNTLPGQTPQFQAYLDPELGFSQGTAVTAEVFAFDGWEGYADELKKCVGGSPTMNVQVDTGTLQPVATQPVETIPVDTEDFSNAGSWAFTYPETLPEGYYLVNFSFLSGGTAYSRQHFLQVSHYSFFYMLSGDNLLAWLNDTESGKPVSGALVSMDGDFTAGATTGPDGTAQVAGATVSESRNPGRFGTLMTVKNGDDVFVDVNNYYTYGPYYHGEQGEMTAQSRQYISYLYTDRPLYRTTDTIQVWGVARSRDKSLVAAPENATLKLSTYGSSALAEVDCTVGKDGTFTASLPVDKLANNWYQLELWIGEVLVDTQYLNIEDFVKPIYAAETSTDQPVYMIEDNPEVTVDMSVAMFDGTPATQFGVELGVNEDMSVLHADSQTGEQGHAAATLRIFGDRNTWYPTSFYYNYSGTQPQAEPLWLYGNVYGIYRDTMLRGEMVPGTDGQSAEITTHAMDISGIETEEQLWDYRNLQGAPLDIPVTAQLYHVYYEKTVTGTYYDFIDRETRESYTYTRQEELVDTYQFQTTNGQYQLDGLPKPDMDNSYYLSLSTLDSHGKTVEFDIYLGTLYERWGYASSAKTYELRKNTNPDQQEGYEYEGVIEYYWMGGRFGDGEEASFTLYAGDAPVPQGQGQLLYTVVQDDFSHTAVQPAGGVTIPFDEKLVPNYLLTGAYFDGLHTYMLTETPMRFNPEDRQLEIEVKTDADSYAPGGQVSVEVSAVYAATGEPAADVSLVLGVVDEAIFALQEQDIDILSNLYRSIYFPEIQKYSSGAPTAEMNAGEMGGGGGGGETRKDFADTAQMLTQTTGADGKAQFSFTLPDNITTWRLSALGITPAGDAGSKTAPAISTKPFFVTPIVSETLQQGDSLAVGLYGAGAQVDSGDLTQYTIQVKGPGVDETKTAQSLLRVYSAVDFGKLPLGSYTVTVLGQCGTFQDAVELPVEVVASGLEIPLVESVSLSDGIRIEPGRWPVSAVFYGEGGKTYTQVLRNLQWNSAGKRADMRLARAFVAQKIKAQGGWFDEAALNESIADIDGTDLLALFPYGTPDLELSLKAHLAAPELVSADFLSRALSPDSFYLEETSAAVEYLAQVMAGQVPDADLYALATGNATPNFTDKMYLAMALSLSGDDAQATKVYSQLVLPALIKTTAVDGEEMLAVAGRDGLASEPNTASASLLATMLKTKEAEGLMRQLAEKESLYEPYLLEQMYYLSTFSPEAKGAGSFTYQRDGKEVTVELDGTLTAVTFSQAQLEEAAFKVTSGTVYADIYYRGGPQQLDPQSPGNRIGLTKTIEPVEGSGYGVGQLVKVTLTPDFSGLDTTAGNRMLTIEDYIPSGLRFERYAPSDGYPYNADMSGWFLASRQGQSVQFALYGLWLDGGIIEPIVYYARVAAPGTYVVESAYISSTSANAWGLSQREAVILG